MHLLQTRPGLHPSLPLYPPLSLSHLLPLVSELLSLLLSLPELTTQEVTTDSINSSYINPAIIAPSACRSASPSFSLLSLYPFTLSSHPGAILLFPVPFPLPIVPSDSAVSRVKNPNVSLTPEHIYTQARTQMK